MVSLKAVALKTIALKAIEIKAVALSAKRSAILIALAALLAACGSTPSRDGTPPRKLNPDDIKDAVPKYEPITKAGNKSPYTVLGQTYVLMPSSKGYRQTGIASWYGTKFHGQSTSNGETYDVYEMTAAHKTLPIPTYVLVTNLENNRQAIVRVNDRGPFVSNRIIDLSYAAAVKLGYADKGTAFVEVAAIDVDNWPPRGTPDAPPVVAPPLAPAQPLSQVVSPAPLPASDTPAATADSGATTAGEFYVQAGAFGDPRAAETLRKRLAKNQSNPVFVQRTPSGPVLYRVRIGPLRDRAAAEQLRNQLLVSHMSESASIVDADK
ncbi:MAG: septal ring lytic transglycosylase RlpA family protein [Spongiibacteraceae bacterium]